MKRLHAQLESQRDGSVILEVEVQSVPVLYGNWTYDVHYGKKELSAEGYWRVICKHSERGCEYVETELELSRGYRLQRSVLVSRQDQLMLLMDAVLADTDPDERIRKYLPKVRPKTAAPLYYRSGLYFSSRLRARTFEDATEIELRPVCRILPLALPEWKGAHSGMVTGTFSAKSGSLEQDLRISGRSVCAALLFDFNTARLGKRYTWRRLSVGEEMRLVEDDHAVGYRIQLGQDQYLVYRSLTPLASRTVLGCNLIDDFCFARFNPETGMDPLVAIEVTG